MNIVKIFTTADNKYQRIIDACGGTCWHRRWKVLITSINPHYLLVGFPCLDKPFWVCVCVCLCDGALSTIQKRYPTLCMAASLQPFP